MVMFIVLRTQFWSPWLCYMYGHCVCPMLKLLYSILSSCLASSKIWSMKTLVLSIFKGQGQFRWSQGLRYNRKELLDHINHPNWQGYCSGNDSSWPCICANFNLLGVRIPTISSYISTFASCRKSHLFFFFFLFYFKKSIERVH